MAKTKRCGPNKPKPKESTLYEVDGPTALKISVPLGEGVDIVISRKNSFSAV